MRLLIILIILLPACTTIPTPKERAQDSVTLAEQFGWSFHTITADLYTLSFATPTTHQKDPRLTVYIEGDGLAWITSTVPSDNPTPINPVALKLALKHSKGNAAYLARPCQYTGITAKACNSQVWTIGRFSEAVIHSMDIALSKIKEKYHAERITLVGYSGGGAVAALIAARRDDIEKLITIASPLDHEGWTSEKRISPLKQSLNPADFWYKLQHIRQIHFVGSNDKIVGEQILNSYANRFPLNFRPEIRLIKGFGHSCCWEEQWPYILKEACLQ